MRKLLTLVGGLVAFFALLIIATYLYLAWAYHGVAKVAARFTPGMTADAVIAALPYDDHYLLRVGPRAMTTPCKDKVGNLYQASEYPAVFPLIGPNQSEGVKLGESAQQLPLQFQNFDALDQYLRERQEWSFLVRAWTVFLQNSDTPNAAAYLRRASAYLALNDLDHAYKDMRGACKLGDKEGCVLAAKIPKDRIAAVEAEEAKVAADTPSCEKPLPSFSVHPGPTEFIAQFETPSSSGASEPKRMSRAEFVETVTREYRNREWMLGFTYFTMTPQHISFSVYMGREGRVQSVGGPHSWD